MTSQDSLRGARVAVIGRFACGLNSTDVESIVRAFGAIPADADDPTVTLAIRGAITKQLSSRVGASPQERALASRAGVRWIEEDSLDALCCGHFGVSLADAIGRVDRSHARSARTLDEALARPEAGGIAVFREALLGPAALSHAVRQRVANALVSLHSKDALEVLANALRCARGVPVASEAHAFGVLAARGITRFDRPAPIAIEVPLLGRIASDPIESRAARVGACERMTDDDGAAWLRVRCAHVPPLPEGARGVSWLREPFYALLREASRRTRARVWIAGHAIPAAIGWESWLALLVPLAAPAIATQRT